MKRVIAILGALMVSGFSGQAVAQEYPSKAVRLIIPFAAGAGANDVLGRFVAKKLQALWNQPVIAENRPGANATIGSMSVIRSAPDGYNMLFTSANYAMTPALFDITFDAEKDLKPVGLVGLGEYLLITGAHVKANGVKEFIVEAKTREVTYGSSGPGADFAAALFSEAAGIKMKRVPYKGTNDSFTDLLGGRVDFVVASVGTQIEYVKEGKVKPLAVTSANRSKQLPNVPSMREIGFQSAELPTWWGIFVPAATPDAIVNKINASLDTVLNDPETKSFFDTQSVTPENMKPDVMQKMLSDSIVLYKSVAERNGLKAQN